MAYAGLALGLTLGLGTGIASGARAQAPETASGSTLLMASAEVDQPQQLEIFQGRLQTARVGCPGVDSAILISCEGAEEIWVKAVPGVDVGRYFGQLVAIEGTLRQCGSNRYIDMNTLSPLRRCGDAGATIAPETVNLALGRVDWASPDGGPQGWMGFAADADQASAWTAEGGSAFIRVNLGENRTFNRMRLLWGARHATQYGLYVWDDADGRWVRFYQKSTGSPDETVTVPRVFGQFVLLQLARSSGANGGYDLREWEIYGVETPNLALGSQVQVSSQATGQSGDQAVDADEATAWISEAGDAHPWIYVRFARPMPLTEFRLVWNQRDKPAVFRVGFYQDGTVKVWSQRLTSTSERQRLAWSTPIVSDAFYIYTEELGGSRSQVALHDLQLYGSAGGLGSLLALPGPGSGEDGLSQIRALEGLTTASSPEGGGPSLAGSDDSDAPTPSDSSRLSAPASGSAPAPDPR